MSNARKLKTDPAVLAGLLAQLAEDTRYGRDKAILLEAAELIQDQLIDPEPMTIEEAATFVGGTTHWLRELAATGKIPFHQTEPRSRLLFDRRALRAWWSAIRKVS